MEAIPRKIEEIIDKKLSEKYNKMSITSAVNVGIKCVKAESFCRPTIIEVVVELREVIKLDEMQYHKVSKLWISMERRLVI